MRRRIEGLGVGQFSEGFRVRLWGLLTAGLLALCSFAAAAPATPTESASALTTLIDQLTQFQQLHLRFEQRATDPGGELQQGDFYLQRPAQFRLESVDQPLVVSDGETIYEYDALLAQLKLQSFASLTALSPAKVLLMTESELSAAFAVTFDDESGSGARFRLVPTDTASLIAWVQIAFAADVPSQIILMTQSKMQVSIALTLISLNAPLPPALFQFEVPEGIDVIDDR
ncbi:MAG: outer-membrane lipoprotein carrier protein LolA [Pseudomonadales bacterium]|jgi:outer membrane lipoprotein carrier protein|tara:strand:- start:25 stop:711 length:687 start_codon:yes stop_codon:yes gene_type:complete